MAALQCGTRLQSAATDIFTSLNPFYRSSVGNSIIILAVFVSWVLLNLVVAESCE